MYRIITKGYEAVKDSTGKVLLFSNFYLAVEFAEDKGINDCSIEIRR